MRAGLQSGSRQCFSVPTGIGSIWFSGHMGLRANLFRISPTSTQEHRESLCVGFRLSVCIYVHGHMFVSTCVFAVYTVVRFELCDLWTKCMFHCGLILCLERVCVCVHVCVCECLCPCVCE